MSVQGDTCLFSALQTSSLNSCYVWIKRTGSGSLAAPTRSVTLNCVPCQLQTHCAAEEVTGLTPLSLPSSLFPFSPLFHLFYRTLHFNATYSTQKTEWCTGDTSQSDSGTFLFFFWSAPIKHEACLVRLPWQPVSKSLPCLCEAEKQMSWVCLPLLDRAVKICSWRTLKTAQMERMSLLRFSIFTLGTSVMMRHSELFVENSVGLSAAEFMHLGNTHSWLLCIRNVLCETKCQIIHHSHMHVWLSAGICMCIVSSTDKLSTWLTDQLQLPHYPTLWSKVVLHNAT